MEDDSITIWTPLCPDSQPTPQEVLAILSEQKIEEIDFCLRALLDGVTTLGITDLLLDRRNELADELEVWRG